MSDLVRQYFCMVSNMRNPKTNELAKKIIMENGLPELMQTTSSPALRTRIQKVISHGYQSNQRAG